MNYLPEPSFKPYRVYSDGAGTQSVSVMVMQAMGLLHYDAYVFCNVGERVESKETMDYRREIMIPFALKHGINMIERRRILHGQPVDLYDYTLSPDNRSIPIPVKFEGKGGFGNRSCTVEWKVEVVNRYIKNELRVPYATMGIGYSADEGGRIWKKYKPWHDHSWSWDQKTKTWKMGKRLGYWRQYEFPIAERGINRGNAIALIKNFGLPEPPHSGCWFCPFEHRSVHINQKATGSPIYEAKIAFQDALNEKYSAVHANNPKASTFVSIHRDGLDLRNIADQPTLFDMYMDTDESCTNVCGV